MIVTGGRRATSTADRPRSRATTRSAALASLPPFATARSGHAAVASGGRLVVLGGEELGGGTTIEQVELSGPEAGGARCRR